MIGRPPIVAAALLGLLQLGLSCGPGTPLPEEVHECFDAPLPGDEADRLEVGRGAAEGFATFEEGAALAVEHGPQGGEHVTLTLRLFTKVDGRWVYDFELLQGSQSVGRGSTAADSCPGGWIESRNLRLFLDGSHQTGAANLVVDAHSDQKTATAHVEVPVALP